ncbi:MAG: nuclear transport factor 2 family protein [Bacteroidales bacterium]
MKTKLSVIRFGIILFVLNYYSIVPSFGQDITLPQKYCQVSEGNFDKSKALAEIKRLYEIEKQLILQQDTAGFRKFYPDDFVVTNPFNQFIDKNRVIERQKSNIIKYISYERTFDYFQFYGNSAIVIGSEVVVPTHDANRDDAGKTVNRRFTEVWVLREGSWQKVVRHASNIIND